MPSPTGAQCDGAYAETAVPAEVQTLMREAARPFGVELSLFEDMAMRDAVAELVVDADHIQFADPAFRDELASWMHPLTSPAGDGLAGPGFGFPTGRRARQRRCSARSISAAPSPAWTSRTCSARRCWASSRRKGDTRGEWIATGRALAAVLHTLTMHGLVNAFLNQPIEVTSIRPKLAELASPGRTPQLLEPLRLSEGRRGDAPARRAPPARRSPHRRLKRQRPPTSGGLCKFDSRELR